MAEDRSVLFSDITTDFPDNTSGDITPLILRTFLTDQLAALQMVPSVNEQAGPTHAFVFDDFGKFTIYTGDCDVDLPNANAGGFEDQWNVFVSNSSSGVVVITPTGCTIGGAASLTLLPGQSIFIVSDGTNYLTAFFSTPSPTYNGQTGTSYTFLAGDNGKLVTFNNGSAIAVTLPQATGAFANWSAFVRNIGAGTATITPTTSTINGAATKVLTTGQFTMIVSDGTNYQIAY